MALLWELADLKKGENNFLPTTYGPKRIKPIQGANISPDKEPNRQQKKCLCLQGTGGIMVCRASKKGRELKEWLNTTFFRIRKSLSHLHRKQTALKTCSRVSLSVLQLAGYLKTLRKKWATLPCVHVHVLIIQSFSFWHCSQTHCCLENMHKSPANHQLHHRALKIHLNRSLPFEQNSTHTYRRRVFEENVV